MGRGTGMTKTVVLGTLVAFCLISLGCSSRERSTPDPSPHPKVAPVDYGWVWRAFEGHSFLALVSVQQQNYRLPGKVNVEVRLKKAQPEGLVKSELMRIHRVLVQPDRRLQAISYFVRGLGEAQGGVLQGDWGRGYRFHWSRVPLH
jgi:hypothetical protein